MFYLSIVIQDFMFQLDLILLRCLVYETIRNALGNDYFFVKDSHYSLPKVKWCEKIVSQDIKYKFL